MHWMGSQDEGEKRLTRRDNRRERRGESLSCVDQKKEIVSARLFPGAVIHSKWRGKARGKGTKKLEKDAALRSTLFARTEVTGGLSRSHLRKEKKSEKALREGRASRHRSQQWGRSFMPPWVWGKATLDSFCSGAKRQEGVKRGGAQGGRDRRTAPID